MLCCIIAESFCLLYFEEKREREIENCKSVYKWFFFMGVHFLFVLYFDCDCLEFAFGFESLSHGLWHGRWWWSWESKTDLYAIVDEPLESRERTNHDDTWAQTGPAALPSQILENLTGADAWRLVQYGHNAIGRVRDDGTEDTGDVTGGERDHELLALVALLSWLWYDVLVESFDSLLKATELHHGIWDLTEPEWLETLEEWIAAFLGHLGISFAHVVSVAWHGLDSDLHGLEWR